MLLSVTRLHVVGAAIFRNDLCLIAQRGQAMSLPGKWEFPGGKVEANESPEAALVREAAEELGVRVRVGPFLARGTAPSGARLIQLDVYAAELMSGEPIPCEHAEVRWVGNEALADFDWAEADLPVVPAVQRHMRRFTGE